ncbi:alpha/beta fold hydrolase [Chelatococcus sp. SYSU_G07232]|uniref:Alpha/beta fold hydrolase n=1 Tax=Chelatococcus albus TaxID=3047466 RepID=A0ABT7AKY0_9HYPH|nr:alpha/beta fold hydrolase [Chelatococcus sp. SYSU_G07232]MDJ1160038.1 alpha/beta fold hydrolase [Chelatococcus sp. SYSU_G07232]
MTDFRFVADIGAGRPLVLLHGWSAHGGFFAAQHALASAGYRLLVPDLPGHGRDRRPGAALTIAGLAAGLDRFLAARDLSEVVLVGWSMGAIVAFDYLAARGTGRVAGLVVVDMTARIVNDEGWNLGLATGLGPAGAERAAVAMQRDWPRYARRIAPSFFAPGLGADHPLAVFAEMAVADNDPDTLAGLWRSLAAVDHRETVGRLDLPCLVVAGAESQLYRPAATAWLADTLPRGRLLALPGAGHTPHLEQPSAFNAALAAFAELCRAEGVRA